MKPKKGAVAATLALTAAITVGQAGGAQADSPPGHAPPETRLSLITGDQVRFAGPHGERVAAVTPGAGRENVGYSRVGTRILPHDAAGLVTAGRLDPRLFEATSLVHTAGSVAAADSTPVSIKHTDGTTTHTTLADARELLASDGPSANRLPRGIQRIALRRPQPTRSPDAVTVTVHTIGRDGKPPHDAQGTLIDSDGAPFDFQFDKQGNGTVEVLPGDYDLFVTSTTMDPKGGPPQTTVLSDPQVKVDGPTEVSTDARGGHEVTGRVDRPDAQHNWLHTNLTPGNTGYGAEVIVPNDRRRVFAVPVRDPVAYDLTWNVVSSWNSPPGAAELYQYNLAFSTIGYVPSDLDYTVHDKDLAAVDTFYPYHDLTRASRTNMPVGVLGYTADMPLPLQHPVRQLEYYTPGHWTQQLVAVENGGGRDDIFYPRKYQRTWRPELP